jgi:hypothetical protein
MKLKIKNQFFFEVEVNQFQYYGRFNVLVFVDLVISIFLFEIIVILFFFMHLL